VDHNIIGPLLNILRVNNIEMAKGFLRHMRQQTLEKPDSASESVFWAGEMLLAGYVGPSYDAVEDWAKAEAAETPSVDWQALATIVAHEELWLEGQDLYRREVYMHSIGYDIARILSLPNINNLQIHKVVEDIPEKDRRELAAQYTIVQIILAIHQRGQTVHMRKLAESIQQPSVRAFLAEQLLRRGDETYARQIIMTIEDPHVLVGMLRSSAWPNPAVPQKILADITELKTVRVGEKIMSPYPVEFRADCINALADMQEEAGRDASDLRRRPASQW
jgi:hypothetical protein